MGCVQHIQFSSVTGPHMLPSHRDQKIGTLSLLMTFQRAGSRVLEKNIFCSPNWQEVFKKFTSQRHRERIYNKSFLK